MASQFKRLKDKKPIVREAVVALDDDLDQALEDARSALQIAKLGGDDDTSRARREEAQARFDELRDDFRANHAVVLRFRAIGRKPWAELKAQHKPSDEQIRDMRKQHGVNAQLRWNEDTFPAAACAASHWPFEGEEAMTADEFQELFDSDTFSDGEIGEIVSKALAANEEGRQVGDLGK